MILMTPMQTVIIFHAKHRYLILVLLLLLLLQLTIIISYINLYFFRIINNQKHTEKYLINNVLFIMTKN